MDSGTNTWVIVLAAFGGGLIGAVIQPMLSYALEKLRAKDERRKSVEKHLRHMITEWLTYALRAGMMANELAARMQLSQPRPMDYEIAQRVGINAFVFPSWEPERIKDASLQQMARELYDTVIPLSLRIFDPATSMEWLDQQNKEIGRLRKDIIERMDELDWPEVDD